MSHASFPVYHRMCFFHCVFSLSPPQGNANVVEYLLESTDGESLMLRKDNKGRTPLDLASKSGHAHVLRVINAFRPTGFQRLLQLGTGKGGEASCFCACLFWRGGIPEATPAGHRQGRRVKTNKQKSLHLSHLFSDATPHFLHPSSYTSFLTPHCPLFTPTRSLTHSLYSIRLFLSPSFCLS